MKGMTTTPKKTRISIALTERVVSTLAWRVLSSSSGNTGGVKNPRMRDSINVPFTKPTHILAGSDYYNGDGWSACPQVSMGGPKGISTFLRVRAGDEELRLRESRVGTAQFLKRGGWSVARVLDFYKNPMKVLESALKYNPFSDIL